MHAKSNPAHATNPLQRDESNLSVIPFNTPDMSKNKSIVQENLPINPPNQ